MALILPTVIVLLLLVANAVNCVGPSLDFDFDEDDVVSSSSNEKPLGGTGFGKEQALQEALLKAMHKPEMRRKIGQVIPILRAMSPPQRLTLAALVSAQVLTPSNAPETSMEQFTGMFSNSNDNPQNVSENLLLPISVDIAKMFRGLLVEAGRSIRFSEPTTVAPIITKNESHKVEEISRRLDVDNENFECEHITTDICIEDSSYPDDEILTSIREHLAIKESFLSEFSDMKQDEPRAMPLVGPDRRQDEKFPNEVDGAAGIGLQGHMCPSTVKYARPKRARTTSGQWKYIVNTGDYTQTLRLEMCMKQGASCSYLNNQFKSTCNQVYNYHRLMTWSTQQGLHMDVFKVPSCCSCHVQGYAAHYPPNDFPYAEKRRETIPPYVSNSGVKREIPRIQQQQPVFAEPPQYQVNELPLNDHQSAFHPQTDQRLRLPEFTAQEFHTKLVNVRQKPNRLHQAARPVKQSVEHSSMNIADHLVPPGPPLPLENERKIRPGLDTRRRPSNQTRYTENNVFVESTGGRIQEDNFGSKIPKRRPSVFVTPNPPLTTIRDNQEMVHVTPKPSNIPSKPSKKKINYNYHPIIDFFARDAFIKNPSQQQFATHRSSNEWTPLARKL